jgi:16S rRNA (cytosine967-C5)-methyltransferase
MPCKSVLCLPVNHYYSYLNSAAEVIASYNGEEPFSNYLKKFFSTSKKYGSKDRKQIAHLCYCYFRLGKMAIDLETKERILLALFLCSYSFNEMLHTLKPDWDEFVELPVQEKFISLTIPDSISDVFPWKEHLSKDVDYNEFCKSFFIQPDLFLRLRPGFETIVKEKLSAAGISFLVKDKNCISIPNTSKADAIIEYDKEAVVQDFNSQRTGELMLSAMENLQLPVAAWDCCAASGGKSIMLYDINPELKLTVTDIRESILANLKTRFAKAGIHKYKSFIADLSNSLKQPDIITYDLIIADVPCSGSGTWGRTPEQIFFFNETKISAYNSLQKKIVNNIVSCIKPGGYLVYITCSVFKKENEDVVEFIQKEKGLHLTSMELLKGYDQKADTLFAALLYKPL